MRTVPVSDQLPLLPNSEKAWTRRKASLGPVDIVSSSKRALPAGRLRFCGELFDEQRWALLYSRRGRCGGHWGGRCLLSFCEGGVG